MARIIKVGDSVTCRIGNELYTSTIEGIEICKDGDKYGRSVTKCDLSKHKNGVVDLKEHWAYFYQITKINS